MKSITHNIILSLCLLFFIGCDSPQNIIITLDAPSSVNVGDKFTIKTKIKNTDTTSQKLVSIDIASGYLKGAAIIKTIPQYHDVMYIPIDNTSSYSFNEWIGPGEEITVKFYAKAIKRGIYNSEIDFCINSDMSFLTRTIFTEIK